MGSTTALVGRKAALVISISAVVSPKIAAVSFTTTPVGPRIAPCELQVNLRSPTAPRSPSGDGEVIENRCEKRACVDRAILGAATQ